MRRLIRETKSDPEPSGQVEITVVVVVDDVWKDYPLITRLRPERLAR